MQENMAQLQREGEKNDTMEWPSQEAWDRNCERLERELDERDREEEEQEKKKQQKAVEPRKRKMQEEEQSKEEQKDVKPWKRAYRKKKMREEELGKEEQKDVKRRKKRASMTKEEIIRRKEQQRKRKEKEAQAQSRPMNLVQIERDRAENDGRKGEEGREIEESEVPASSSGERLTLTSLDQPAAANPVFGYEFETPLHNTPESSSGDRYGSATTYGQRVSVPSRRGSQSKMHSHKANLLINGNFMVLRSMDTRSDFLQLSWRKVGAMSERAGTPWCIAYRF